MGFEAMQEAAARLGWTLSPEAPSLIDAYGDVTIRGADRGIPVILARRASTYGFTTTAFFEPPLTPRFAITTEGVRGKIANALGMHDIEIGDAAFDDTFRVLGEEPERVKRLLTAEVRAAMQKLHASTNVTFNGFSITNVAVSIDRAYMTNLISTDDVLSDIPLATEVVRALRIAGTDGYR